MRTGQTSQFLLDKRGDGTAPAQPLHELDLVEQSAAYLDVALQHILRHYRAKLGKVQALPLQDCVPAALIAAGEAAYDLVWVQWVVLYLSDAELIAFLRRCRTALATDRQAYIVVKDNITRSTRFWVDNEDGSVTIPEVLRKYMGGKEKILPQK